GRAVWRLAIAYSGAGSPAAAAARKAELPIAGGSFSAASGVGSAAGRWFVSVAGSAWATGSEPVISLVRAGEGGGQAVAGATLSRGWEPVVGVMLPLGTGESRKSSPAAIGGRRAAGARVSGTIALGTRAALASTEAGAGFALPDGVSKATDILPAMRARSSMLGIGGRLPLMATCKPPAPKSSTPAAIMRERRRPMATA